MLHIHVWVLTTAFCDVIMMLFPFRWKGRCKISPQWLLRLLGIKASILHKNILLPSLCCTFLFHHSPLISFTLPPEALWHGITIHDGACLFKVCSQSSMKNKRAHRKSCGACCQANFDSAAGENEWSIQKNKEACSRITFRLFKGIWPHSRSRCGIYHAESDKVTPFSIFNIPSVRLIRQWKVWEVAETCYVLPKQNLSCEKCFPKDVWRREAM